MRRLWPVVLAALPAVACNPDPHPDITAATYDVTLSAVLQGVVFEPGKGDSVSYARVDWAGSAVAVSSSGDLLTARHVVSLTSENPTLCHGYVINWELPSLIRNVRVAVYRLSVRGPGWLDRWSGTAVSAARKDWCDSEGSLNLDWSPDSTVTVDTVDGRTDLALLRLKTSGIAHLPFNRTPPKSGTAVVAMGSPRLFRVPAIAGTVFLPCVLATHDKTRVAPMPMVEFLPAMEKGMSGGPLIVDGSVAGINVMVMPGGTPPRSYAVYGPYVAAWYDWVRKKSGVRPTAVCPQ